MRNACFACFRLSVYPPRGPVPYGGPRPEGRRRSTKEKHILRLIAPSVFNRNDYTALSPPAQGPRRTPSVSFLSCFSPVFRCFSLSVFPFGFSFCFSLRVFLYDHPPVFSCRVPVFSVFTAVPSVRALRKPSHPLRGIPSPKSACRSRSPPSPRARYC